MALIDKRDELFTEAAKLVVKHQKASTPFLQIKLILGYHRAGRIMNQLYLFGIVGEYKEYQPREVIIKTTEQLTEYLEMTEALYL